MFLTAADDEDETHLNRNGDIPRMQALVDSHEERLRIALKDLDESNEILNSQLDKINALENRLLNVEEEKNLKITELETFIASYQLAAELATSENEHLQRQFNTTTSRCDPTTEPPSTTEPLPTIPPPSTTQISVERYINSIALLQINNTSSEDSYEYEYNSDDFN